MDLFIQILRKNLLYGLHNSPLVKHYLYYDLKLSRLTKVLIVLYYTFEWEAKKAVNGIYHDYITRLKVIHYGTILKKLRFYDQIN